MEKLNTKNLKYIDLSRTILPMQEPISPETLARGVMEEGLVWPIETYDSFVDDTVCQYVKLKTHVKTHVESPWHLDKKGVKLSDFKLEHFVGRMVHLRFDVPERTTITREMVEKADAGDIKKGDIVCVSTTVPEGINPEAEHEKKFPVFSGEATKYLFAKGIKAFALDCSFELGKVSDGIRPHDYLLKNGIPLIEMLTNLDKLSQKVCYMIAIPGMIKIQGLDSSTTPVLAIEGLEVM